MGSRRKATTGKLPKFTARLNRRKSLISKTLGNHSQLSEMTGKCLPMSSHGRGRWFNPSRAHHPKELNDPEPSGQKIRKQPEGSHRDRKLPLKPPGRSCVLLVRKTIGCFVWFATRP
jgi:hypothetical protein